MRRLFTALALPEDLRSRLAGLQGGIEGARWVAPENLHITLRFIGEVPDDRTADIVEALDGVGGRPFPINVSGAGRFASGDRARSLWAGVERNPEIVALHTGIDRALIRIGHAPEGRKYTPHITLARFGGGGRGGGRRGGPSATRMLYWLEAHGGFFAPPFEAQEFVLYESRLGRGGPAYTPVADFPLSGA